MEFVQLGGQLRLVSLKPQLDGSASITIVTGALSW